MKRDPRLAALSREHTQALMLAQRIRRELPAADDDAAGAIYASVVAFWSAGLLPHFTAEGECLLALGCEIGQGFAIAPPLPPDEFLPWLRGYERAPLCPQRPPRSD